MKITNRLHYIVLKNFTSNKISFSILMIITHPVWIGYKFSGTIKHSYRASIAQNIWKLHSAVYLYTRNNVFIHCILRFVSQLSNFLRDSHIRSNFLDRVREINSRYRNLSKKLFFFFVKNKRRHCYSTRSSAISVTSTHALFSSGRCGI